MRTGKNLLIFENCISYLQVFFISFFNFFASVCFVLSISCESKGVEALRGLIDISSNSSLGCDVKDFGRSTESKFVLLTSSYSLLAYFKTSS